MKKNQRLARLKMGRILRKAKADTQVLAALLFGSRARAETTPSSDIDLCLVLEPGVYSPLDLSRKKMGYLKGTDIDIQIFQQLPLPIKNRILREGKILFCKNEEALYAEAYLALRQFSRFSRFYQDYLKAVQNGR